MKHQKFLYMLAIAMSTLLTFDAGNGTAQATANGPYYAWPSWDQTLPSNTRFIVLSNFNSQAVLDRETGLVWERAPLSTERTWSVAHIHCNEKTVGNRKGWRVPTIQELASLIDPSVASPGPTLPAGHPFINVQAVGRYWSATTVADFTTFAWYVRFDTAQVLQRSKTDDEFVWCVRAPHGVDPQ